LRNCPECNDKYFEYRQETVNRRSVHERIGRIHPSDDRHQKIIDVIDHPRKRRVTRDGLIKMRRNTNTSGRKDVPAWLEEKPKEKGSALEEPRIEAGGDPKKASMAPKGQT
jgi:hypothetical protein